MVKLPSENTYYCLFDPTTGKRLGGYIEGVHEIPTDAIRVSYSDFVLYASNPNWVYDWDKKEPRFKNPMENIDLAQLRSEILAKLNELIKKDIESGVTVEIPKIGPVRFDTDLETQITVMQYLNSMTRSSANATAIVRGYVKGSTDKALLNLDVEQLTVMSDAITAHISAAKQRGFERREYVNSPSRTVQELLTYYNNL